MQERKAVAIGAAKPVAPEVRIGEQENLQHSPQSGVFRLPSKEYIETGKAGESYPNERIIHHPLGVCL